jgi:hypothetical protein
VQGRPAAPPVAAVLDVVVDQEGAVGQLDRGRRGQRVVLGSAEGATGGQAERGPKALAGAPWVVGQRLVQPLTRLAAGEMALDLLRRPLAVVAQQIIGVGEGLRDAGHPSTSSPATATCSGRYSSGTLDTRMTDA